MGTTRIAAAVMLLLVVLAAQASTSYSMQLDIPVLTKPYIIDPTYGIPVFVRPGEELVVKVRSDSEIPVRAVVLASVDSPGVYRLEVSSYEWGVIELQGHELQGLTIRAVVPAMVEPGLYNLIVELGEGYTWMPRSVYVYTSLEGERVRIIHISDLQMGAADKGIPNSVKYTKYAVLVNTLARFYDADLVLFTGDNSDIGTDVASYIDVYTTTNQFLIPTLMVPGNHDWAQVPSVKDFVENYMGRFINPYRYWYRVYGDLVIVGLDTGSEGFIGEDQIRFVEEVARRFRDKAIILFSHHPFISRPGNYSGELDSFRGALYGSWRDRYQLAVELFEVLKDNSNIVAWLAGHIHRDSDAVYIRSDGSRLYFIATTTAVHGYPPGAYWGFKVIDLYPGEGRLEVVTFGAEYRPDASSINTESFNVYEITDPQAKSFTWIFDTRGFTQIDPSSMVLVFILNKTVPIDEYKFYYGAERIKSVERITTELYHLIIAVADLSGRGKIVLSSYEDAVPPKVRVKSMFPLKPSINKVVTITIEAVDEGWGVERVEAILKGPAGEISLKVFKSVVRNEYTVRFRITDPGSYQVIVTAYDVNGNEASTVLELSVEPPARPMRKAGQQVAVEATPVEEENVTNVTVEAQEEVETEKEDVAEDVGEAVETAPEAEGGEGGQAAPILLAAIAASIIILLAAYLKRKS